MQGGTTILTSEDTSPVHPVRDPGAACSHSSVAASHRWSGPPPRITEGLGRVSGPHSLSGMAVYRCTGVSGARLAAHQPLLTHYACLPRGHGAAPDDPQWEESVLQVPQETPRQLPGTGNVINADVPFGDATEPFFPALAEAYRQIAMLAPTIIIGDMNAAPTLGDQGGQATPQDHAVRNTIEMLGLMDLRAILEGQQSHFPHQTDAAPSRIDVCYGAPTTIIRVEARYGPLPLRPTGHSPLHVRFTIPNLPPSPPEDADQGLPPPLRMPPMQDKQAWSQSQRAIDRARGIQQDPTDLLTAMRTGAVACGFQQQPHTEDDQPPTALGDMFNDLWHAKQQLATLRPLGP